MLELRERDRERGKRERGIDSIEQRYFSLCFYGFVNVLVFDVIFSVELSANLHARTFVSNLLALCLCEALS